MEIDQLTDEQIANLTPEQITELENNPEKVAEIVAQQDVSGKATGKSKQEEQDGAANGADDEEEPVVLTKNGKGVIPYANHKGLRIENATLKEQLQAMQQRLDELSRQKEQGRGTQDATAEVASIEQQMATLKEDMPDLHTIISSLGQSVEELKRDKQEATRRSELTVAEQVQEAKDNNPDLVHWENNDPEAWDEALKQDEILRTNAKWAQKTYEERFVEVVRRVKAVNQSVSKPNTPESVKATAKARLEQAPARRPTTLSDIHGGEIPKSERERAENMSTLELTQHLMKAPAHVGVAMRADLD